MLPDEMTGHVPAQVKEIENYTVRLKSDMDEESSDVEEKIEQEKVNETAAANDEISKKDVEIRRLIEEEKKHFQKGETTVERFEQEQRDMKKIKYSKSSKEPRTFPASSQQKEEYSSPRKSENQCFW